MTRFRSWGHAARRALRHPLLPALGLGALLVTLLMVGAGSARAQAGYSMVNNTIVNDTYGGGPSLWGDISGQPGVVTAFSSLCRIVRFTLLLGASAGVLWSLFNLYFAARGQDSGRWRLSGVLLIASSVLLAPAATLNMIGLDWIVTRGLGVWTCILR